MKNSSLHPPCLALGRILIVALALCSSLAAHAQLVADGASYTLDGTSVNLGSTNLTVGTNGPNTTLVITNGGMVSESAQGFIGYNASANNNQASVSGPGSTWNNSADLYVGHSGPRNALRITGGGTVSNATNGYVGYNASANKNQAIVSDPGSTWNNGALLHIGEDGPFNTLLVTNGGTVSNATKGVIGFNSGAFNNQAVVSDPGSTWNNGGVLTIGYNGPFNTLVVTNGGTVNCDGGLVGFQGANNRAIVSGTNSVWNTGFTLFVGQVSSYNSLLIADGGTVKSGPSTCYIGWTTTAHNNQIIVDGPGSTWTSDYRLFIGRSSSFNTLLITNGGTVRNVFATDIGAAGDNNEVIVSGPGSAWIMNGTITLGGGSGSFNTLRITDGGKVGNTSCFIDSSTGGNNQVVVSGPDSSWNNSSFVDVGVFGSFSTLLITDGGSVSNTTGTIGKRALANNNHATVSGPGSTWNNSAALYVGRGGMFNTLLITNGGSVQAASATVGLLAGSISNTLVLANGTLTVPGGLLINSNNTLTGSGTINGIVTDRGTIAPGASVGKLVLTDPPVLQGLVVMEISRDGAALTNDQIQVTGELAYGGSLTVTDIGMDAPAVGDSFQLFSASGGYSGGFDSISLPPLPSGLGWTNRLLLNGSIDVVSEPTLDIGGLVRSGANLIFTVTGGSPGGTWTQLTATNVALPIANWTTNRSGNFDGLGSANLTNGINLAEPQRYYLISTP